VSNIVNFILIFVVAVLTIAVGIEAVKYALAHMTECLIGGGFIVVLCLIFR